MFSNLSNFGYNRSGKEALGFYLTYLFLLVLAGSLLSGFVAKIVSEDMLGGGLNLRVGTGIAIVGSVALSYLVLKEKKMLHNVAFIMLALVGGLLATFGGGLLGFIIPAYLTTRKSPTKAKVKKKK